MNTDTLYSACVVFARVKSKPKTKSFGKQVKEARQRLKLSQSEAAAHLGVSVDSLQNWEQERATPDAFKQRAILEGLRR